MPHYTPKSEEQLDREGLLQPGEKDFEIVEVSDKPSKSGSAMYTLKMHVFDEDGSTRIVWDYIVFGNNYGERKFRHAASACGLIQEYEAGALTHSAFMGKCGRCEIDIQEASGGYGAKNVVKDYVKREEGAPPVTRSAKDELEGDLIPF